MPDQDDTLETNYIAGNEANSPADRPEPGTTTGSLADNPLISTPKGGPTPTTEQPTPEASEVDYITGRQQANATNAAPSGEQPNTYGGNFGNGVEPAHHDQGRASNQRADANRGEFGEQGELGATHGGYGNQFREFDTAAERPAAEATEEKYYGDGASRPGLQHNSYQNYDGQDTRPVEQGHAVRDTPAARVMNFDDQPTAPARAEGNTRDTRNDVGETGPNAAFQNDNGAPTVGPAYADDYGHTSGVGLPAGTPSHHLPLGPDGHGLGTDPASARGGYDGQQTEATTPGRGSAPAPVNSPDALQTEGYGYGHQRSEQEKPGNPDTGDSRSGFGPGGSKEGNASQGHGSKGGSYDDENPGARGPEYDNFTKQDKAQNYGQEQRSDFRPEGGDKPEEGDYGPVPRRNAGRDEA
ncbi:MAG TPA: hypothetical protein VFO93_07830 [Hymenobacter sp.]|uniref:hypothetical protein n=1 Tax=Hymenobacter sp. TaxID=1898978 RepID=UPI002D7EF557|nr:hypothetical protein [Hymenobacter sp.]HET9503435.1 hypothetical protein [Hymenobacter sp.]